MRSSYQREVKYSNHQMKNKKSVTWKRLFSYLFRFKFRLIFITLLLLVSNYLLILLPKYSGDAIDIIEDSMGQDLDGVIRLCILMAVLYLVSAIMTYIYTFLFTAVGQKVAFDLREETFAKIMYLSSNSMSKYQSGEVISRLTYDINLISTSITNDFVHIATVIITVVGSVGMMLVISWKLFLIYLIIVPVAILFAKHRAKVTRPLFVARSKDIGDLCRYIDEKMSGTKTIRAYCAEGYYCNEFSQVNKQACESQYKAEYYSSSMFPIMAFISNFTLALISFVGSIMFIFSAISLGNISTFILYSRKFLGSVSEISNLFTEIQSALAASDRIFNLLDEEIETDVTENIEGKIAGDISIENLNFSYVENQPILRNVTLHVNEGETVAIVGETGSGKTTLISLLMRFYDPNSGMIKINGRDISTIPRQQIRENFALVLQSSWIFNDTIKNNIKYGTENVTDEEVIEAAKAANVHDIIMTLPKKYDSVLNENAVNLSKGQKQLIAIARCMIRKSEMLILDEATSNVDTATEKRISDAMENLRKNKTCFIIAHRLSTIHDADKIVVLRQGEIIEVGTHDELMNLNKEYARIYNSQFN